VSPFRRFLFETSLGIKRRWKRNLEQLRCWQDLDEEETRRLQDQHLERLLDHAARQVPYYRDLFHAHGLLRGERVRIGALTEIPCLDRATLRHEFDRLRSDDLAQRTWRLNGTGGSTGVPVCFIQDRESDLWRIAVERLFDEWTGVPFGMRRVRLWGSERDLLVGRDTLKGRIYRWRRKNLLNSA
jgi:phenylacetate-CoA ligase